MVEPAGRADCEAAAAALAERPPHPAGDRVRRAVSTPAAWLLTGTAYATDFTLTTAGGLAAGATVCMPILVLEASLHGDGEGTAHCIAAVAGPIVETGGLLDLGPHVARATRRWRCLDRTGEAREVLSVAGCYRSRGAPGDLAAARALLLGWQDDRRRLDCTPHRERRAFEAAVSAAEAELPEPAGED